MEIFFTDYQQLAGIFSDEHSLIEFLRLAGVPDSMPFILASDGSYDVQLNRFLRELPHNGVRSWHSWKSYALDLLTWYRFLQEQRNTTVWKATPADLIVYHQARRGGLTPLSSDPILNPQGSVPISAASWNRTIAALDKFYQWAHTEGYISTLPFTYREASVLYGLPLSWLHILRRSWASHLTLGLSCLQVSSLQWCACPSHCPSGAKRKGHIGHSTGHIITHHYTSLL